jgi:hypothetical protein
MDGERGSNVPNRGLPPVYKVIVSLIMYIVQLLICLEMLVRNPYLKGLELTPRYWKLDYHIKTETH